MKNGIKLIGITAIIAIIAIVGFSFTACDDALGENESLITISGGLSTGGNYNYVIYNKSSYEVKVTINYETKKIKASSGNSPSVKFTTNTSYASVKYSPSDKVKTQPSVSGITFVNR